MNRLLLIALLAIINYSGSGRIYGDFCGMSYETFMHFLDEVTSPPNELDDDVSQKDEIQEDETESLPPPQHETNPDFALIDDMILSPLQYDVIYTEPSKRNGYSSVVRPWPNAVIPYMIDDDYSINDIYCGQSFSLHIHILYVDRV